MTHKVSNLEIVTPKQNSTHSWDIGLSNREQGRRSKLNWRKVHSIRARYEYTEITMTELADEFKVSVGTISMVINEVTWNE